MRKALWFLIIAASIGPMVKSFPEPAPPQVGPRNYHVVDVTFTKAGEVDYVDGVKVPDDVELLGFLRQQEKSSPRTGLLVFVPVATTVRRIEDLRVIAGKIQYEYLHVYLYDDRYRDSVSEILYGPSISSDDLRLGPHGPLPWPDREAAKK